MSVIGSLFCVCRRDMRSASELKTLFGAESISRLFARCACVRVARGASRTSSSLISATLTPPMRALRAETSLECFGLWVHACARSKTYTGADRARIARRLRLRAGAGSRARSALIRASARESKHCMINTHAHISRLRKPMTM